jgi:hypothetical protein
MALQVYAQYFRLPVNVARPADPVQDLLSSAVPTVATGAALEFDLAFSDGTFNDANLLDLSVFDSVEFRIQAKTNPHSASTYISQSIAAANFQVLDTAAHFNDGTKQQITVAISGAQNVLQTSGAAGNYWLCIFGKLTAAAAAAQNPPKLAGDPVPLCYFQINVIDSGIPAIAAQLPQNFKVGSKISFVCSPDFGGDGLTRDFYMVKLPRGNYAFQIGAGYAGPGQNKFSFLCDPANGGDNLYRDMYLQRADNGLYVPVIDANGHN